ncbi:hypothetical protein Caci_1926 [Catenulispora acidiphila DSM 44928]|uniref:PRC-barrel domain-containing protein n=1 Tax=Catenulispora acidiphila (strain DSM 44928 / JCM 14897 / NBRC 102108 / NRRL B-24433 / ID139908) TaxID=479433 RepID=C7QEF5_CATAD|nr:hypothetical protein [Catenulispora acidiphila]ACU70846.1 hypothetical protein Caci_1926 [Catenulispora acidiphila DSM 44928]
MSTMIEKETPYAIGTSVTCSEGDCGRLHRIIMDPGTRALTHLVVGRDPHAARLVPVSLVGSAGPDMIVLTCTASGFDLLEPAEATEMVQPAAPTGGPVSGGGALGGGYRAPAKPDVVTYDRVPAGEVQLVRNERLHAADGDIGHIKGLMAAPDHHVTHILLSEGHLWSRKEVAVPIRNVVDATYGVQVDLTREELKDLPAVDLTRTS